MTLFGMYEFLKQMRQVGICSGVLLIDVGYIVLGYDFYLVLIIVILCDVFVPWHVTINGVKESKVKSLRVYLLLNFWLTFFRKSGAGGWADQNLL